MCGQKDGQAVLEDTKPQTSGNVGKRRGKVAGKGVQMMGLCSVILQHQGAGQGGWPSEAPTPHLASTLVLHKPMPWILVTGPWCWGGTSPVRLGT